MSPADRPPAQSRWVGPPRHELPLIDERALVAGRAAEDAVAGARARGQDRWVAFLEPLPDRLRDGDIRELRAAAVRCRAAFGPKDSLRDALPPELTEPLLVAVDHLLRELNRYDRSLR